MVAKTYALRVASDVHELAALRTFIQTTCTKLGVDDDMVQDIMLAVNEAATNIIVHGYRTPSGIIDIDIERRDDQTVVVTLTDQAPLFDPTSVPSPDLSLPLASRPQGGMGVHMMRHLMDELDYSVTPDGRNRLCLHKHVGQQQEQEEQPGEYHN